MNLKLVSFGGWLAHHFNQEWGGDHSRTVRPLWLAVFAGLAGLGAGFVAFGLMLQGGDPGNWMGVLLFGGFALLLVVGWLTNTVPFIAAIEEPGEPVRARRMWAGRAVDTHATGVVGLPPDRARFRHRPAVLERSPDGELHLAVKKWRSDFGVSGPPATSASDTVFPGEVSKVRRGTAHLVTEARPAVCFRWKHGPVLLDFADPTTRDGVYAELASLAAGDSPSRRSRSKAE